MWDENFAACWEKSVAPIRKELRKKPYLGKATFIGRNELSLQKLQ